MNPGGHRRRLLDSGPPPEPGAPVWMLTYSDVMSLLLGFFILLLSFSSFDERRFARNTRSVRDAFGVPMKTTGEEGTPEGQSPDGPASGNARARRQALLRRLEKDRTGVRGLDEAVILQRDHSIVLQIPGAALFIAGTDRLVPDSAALLDYVARVAQVEGAGLELRAEVHVAPTGPRAPQFTDAWALTTAQAVSVVQYLRTAGLPPAAVVPVGRGEAVGAAPCDFVFITEGAGPR